MTYDNKQLLTEEGIAWYALMRAEDKKAPDREEKRREWSVLYQECKKRGIFPPVI